MSISRWKQDLGAQCIAQDDAVFTEMIVDLLALPGDTLDLYAERSEEAKREAPTHEKLVKQVSYLVRKKETGKAMQRLSSLGIATVNDRTIEQLQRMHPERKAELKRFTIPPNCTPVRVSTATALELLRGFLDTDRSKPGAMGWSNDIIKPLIGCTRTMKAWAALIARIGSALIPAEAACLLATGKLIPFNKPSKGKIRPINVGTCWMKWACVLALRSPQPRRAMKKLEPIQMGHARAGVERIAHTFRMLYRKGYTILKTDFRNAFNQVSRQCMLKAIQEKCPSLTPLFNLVYAQDSMCLSMTPSLDVVCIWSQTGSRMGCPFGTFAFNLTMDDVYKRILDRLTEGSVELAHTDDLNLALDTQVDLKTVAQATFKIVAEEAEKAGMDLQVPKCDAVRRTNDDDDKNGLIICGTPIGSDAYTRKYANELVDQKTEDLHLVATMHPQVGFTLLRHCIVPRVLHLMRTVPPHLIVNALHTFDQRVRETRMTLLSPADNRPGCSMERRIRADVKASLPRYLGGLGHIEASRVAPGAYWASVAAAFAHDKRISRADAEFWSDMQHCHRLLVPNLDLKELEASGRVVPAVLTNMADLRQHLRKHKKLQRALSLNMHNKRHRSYLQIMSEARGTVTKSDVIAAHTQHSLMKFMMHDIPDLRRPWLPPREFISVARKYLLLPQLTRDGIVQPCGDYEANLCAHRHSQRSTQTQKLLDLFGNHAHSRCPSAAIMVVDRHTMLMQLVSRFASMAGFRCRTEPPNFLLLKGVYTRQEGALLTCPVRANDVERVRELRLQLMTAKRNGGSGDSARAAIRTATNQLKNILGAAPTEIRPDIQMIHERTGRELLLDVAVVHPTCRGYRDNEYKHKGDEQGHTVTYIVHKKIKKYQALMRAMASVRAAGMRASDAVFVPFVLSSYGETCSQVRKLIGQLTSAYGKRISGDSPLDQIHLRLADKKKWEFFRRLRTGLAVVCAKYTALTMLFAGRNPPAHALARRRRLGRSVPMLF